MAQYLNRNGIYLSFVFSFFCLCMATPSFSEDFSQATFHEDIKSIVDRGEMIVALVDKQNPPWFFEDENGNMKGADVELAKEIAKELGVGVRFYQKASSYNAVVDVVALGFADIAISYLSLTLGRAKKVGFSIPYGSFSQALILNQLAYARLKVDGIEKPTLFEKLNQKDSLIAVTNGSSYFSWGMKLFPKATFYLVPSWNDHFVEKLRKGEITAAFRGSFQVRRLIVTNPNLKAFVQPILLKGRPGDVYAAVHPKKPNFLNWINNYIAQKRVNITSDFLFKEYKDFLTVDKK